jgi:hypothetical protein
MKQISKTELEELYQSLTNKEVMEVLGVSLQTLLLMLKRAGIKPKGKGNRRTKIKIVG